jgi:hypothetical protein
MNKIKNVLEMLLVKLSKISVVVIMFMVIIYYAKETEIYKNTINMTGYLFGSICLLMGICSFLCSKFLMGVRFFSILAVIFGMIWTIEAIDGLYHPFTTGLSLVIGIIVSISFGFILTIILHGSFFWKDSNDESMKKTMKIVIIFLSLISIIFLFIIIILKLKPLL